MQLNKLLAISPLVLSVWQSFLNSATEEEAVFKVHFTKYFSTCSFMDHEKHWSLAYHF